MAQHGLRCGLEQVRIWLKGLEADPGKDDLIDMWKNEVIRFHPPHQFDRLVDQVKADFGQPGLDTVALRSRNYERWTAILRNHEVPYDFETKARPLIEKAILLESGSAPPVSGKDVMELLQIPPSALVRQVIERISRMYGERPQSREELLMAMQVDPEIISMIGSAGI